MVTVLLLCLSHRTPIHEESILLPSLHLILCSFQCWYKRLLPSTMYDDTGIQRGRYEEN